MSALYNCLLWISSSSGLFCLCQGLHLTQYESSQGSGTEYFYANSVDCPLPILSLEFNKIKYMLLYITLNSLKKEDNTSFLTPDYCIV